MDLNDKHCILKEKGLPEIPGQPFDFYNGYQYLNKSLLLTLTILPIDFSLF